mmetsp:Transcript_20680/g.47784  ORF Transcript_20680/g.47784 Transcript_20680/m.47784 type:complete len:233 (+) Transcript_20680:88-786(+)|eukprot:CAMPEP_0116843726 /NCGR_PEP_ID=MMETSP0418-20121206/12253_1 /TAXON_ID=1158023 /ORGANISM="Astrosyne radiata, Strain 13vi08-1A" /LENGTH=232 /DNA_ID=CAMNT_0004474521 /DNA_START=155 /DNA_END=853 /DNA_ORIENTATION=+
MSAPSDFRSSNYALALELNNIGVDLLEARAYRSAMRTLREAIQVMKNVVPSTGDDVEPLPMSALTNDSLLQEAYRRLTETQSQPLSPNTEHAVELLNSLGTPLRIESSEMQSPEGGNPDTASAVLLYNFGLVHRWAGCERQDSNLGEGALRLFKMAFSILSERNTLMQLDPEDMSETKLFLLIVVLNALVQLEEEMGKHSEASVWLEQLVRLGRVALDQGEEKVPASFAPAA